MLFRYLHLAFEPPGFHDPALPLAPTAHLLRPVPFSQSGSEGLPSWVADLPERPTIYATLGTVFNSRTPGLFEAILDGLCDQPVNLVLTIGRDRDPAEFGPQPDNVHIERYVPQSLLLPHCDLVITHAGFSTVTAALSCGLPMVAIPIDADQPVNAQRCAALGVAEVIQYGQRTPKTIRDSVQTVLSDPSYRSKAERIRREMALLPGPGHAVALLQRLATKNQPILAA
jgi:MGT family glycosyltransferase